MPHRYPNHMKNNSLVPTRIVNANGIHTTVYRKPSASTQDAKGGLPSVTTKTEQQAPTTAIINSAALVLGISKDTAETLTQKAEELDPESQAALLSLMNQPDPHGTVKKTLADKFGSLDDFHPDPDMEGFSQWVKNADNHLHAVDALVREINDSKMPRTITNATISGLNQSHYRDYTTGQLRAISLITAASTAVAFTNEELDHDLTESEWPYNTHRHLSSSIVLDLITASPEVAAEALRLVIEDHVLTNAELIHRLDGTPRAFTSGVI